MFEDTYGICKTWINPVVQFKTIFFLNNQAF